MLQDVTSRPQNVTVQLVGYPIRGNQHPSLPPDHNLLAALVRRLVTMGRSAGANRSGHGMPSAGVWSFR